MAISLSPARDFIRRLALSFSRANTPIDIHTILAKKNYVQAYTHSNSSATVGGSSYFQHMYVFFKAPNSGETTLTLSKLAGEGATYFDDVRVVESDADNINFTTIWLIQTHQQVR